VLKRTESSDRNAVVKNSAKPHSITGQQLPARVKLLFQRLKNKSLVTFHNPFHYLEKSELFEPCHSSRCISGRIQHALTKDNYFIEKLVALTDKVMPRLLRHQPLSR